MSALMIYGATGYTGRMAARHATEAGLDPILGGRDEVTLGRLAAELGVGYRTFGLDGRAAVEDAIADVTVLLNCAGPFARTARPLMTAAVRVGAHYLDVAAELDSYRLAETLDDEAETAGVLLLPGSGGSVAMLGCLTGHVAERISGATRVRVALHVAGAMSRGSAVSAAEGLTTDCLMRVDGRLTSRNPADSRDFDFGGGVTSCSAVTLPDLITIWRATGIPDIETFVHVADGAFPQGDLAALPDGPTPEQRQAHRYHAAVEVTGADGEVARAVLDTVNGYTFTPLAAAEAARRVLAGEIRSGFVTPATLFGSEFVETIADSRIHDLPCEAGRRH